jgi:hypothetical protein
VPRRNRPTETSRAYILDRLCRDGWAEPAAQVRAGEMRANTATMEAGFRNIEAELAREYPAILGRASRLPSSSYPKTRRFEDRRANCTIGRPRSSVGHGSVVLRNFDKANGTRLLVGFWGSTRVAKGARRPRVNLQCLLKVLRLSAHDPGLDGGQRTFIARSHNCLASGSWPNGAIADNAAATDQTLPVFVRSAPRRRPSQWVRLAKTRSGIVRPK